MVRKHNHKPLAKAWIEAIIREEGTAGANDYCFVARMTDGKVRIGLPGHYFVTSALQSFHEFAERAPKLSRENFIAQAYVVSGRKP